MRVLRAYRTNSDSISIRSYIQAKAVEVAAIATCYSRRRKKPVPAINSS